MNTRIDPTGLEAYFDSPSHATLAAVIPMWKRTLIEQALSALPNGYFRLVDHAVDSVAQRTVVLAARLDDEGYTHDYAVLTVCPVYGAMPALGAPKVTLENGHYGIELLSRAAAILESRSGGAAC